MLLGQNFDLRYPRANNNGNTNQLFHDILQQMDAFLSS
jgi:hypothetical protein